MTGMGSLECCPDFPLLKLKANMDHTSHNRLISFIWSIADDCLRDVYVRGKYRDVILPMVVLRRLDTLLEPSLPIRLRHTPTRCRVRPFAGIEFGVGRCFHITSDAEQ